MLVLTVDTATAGAVCGLVRLEEPAVVVAERAEESTRRHGETLTPHIGQCLAEAGARPGDVDAVVVGVGPGPFTGLRIGMATAAAWAHARGVPVYGVCSVDVLAMTALAAPSRPAGALLVATDARRGEVYWGVYSPSGRRDHGPAVDKAAAVRRWCDAHPDERPAWAVGAGARLYAADLGLPVVDVERPSAVALASSARERLSAGAPTEVLEPLYLRRPDASPRDGHIYAV